MKISDACNHKKSLSFERCLVRGLLWTMQREGLLRKIYYVSFAFLLKRLFVFLTLLVSGGGNSLYGFSYADK